MTARDQATVSQRIEQMLVALDGRPAHAKDIAAELGCSGALVWRVGRRLLERGVLDDLPWQRFAHHRRQRVRALATAGATIDEIAARVGASPHTVAQDLQQLGIRAARRRPRPRPRQQIDVDRVVQMIRDGASTEQLAQALHCSPARVPQVLCRLRQTRPDIPRRSRWPGRLAGVHAIGQLELWAAADIAEHCGLDERDIPRLRDDDPTFPPPRWSVARGRVAVWDARDVRAWHRRRLSRQQNRPPAIAAAAGGWISGRPI